MLFVCFFREFLQIHKSRTKFQDKPVDFDQLSEFPLGEERHSAFTG
jgi:hypothetical protein